jgi:hypothetical protein
MAQRTVWRADFYREPNSVAPERSALIHAVNETAAIERVEEEMGAYKRVDLTHTLMADGVEIGGFKWMPALH